MIESLYVNNYKLFQELRIESLSQVTVFVGENNVGKSSLLEAIQLLLNRSNLLSTLYWIAHNRGEWRGDDFDPKLIAAYLTTFFYRGIFQNKKPIQLQANGIDLSFFLDGVSPDHPIGQQVLVSQMGAQKKEFLLGHYDEYFLPVGKQDVKLVYASTPPDIVSTLSSFWTEIALTSKENDVLDTLKIIDQHIEGLAFVDKYNGKSIILKLSNHDEPVSLGSMGDGMTRLLRIIIGLTSSEGSAFLIDEFETGLHWSIQVELWKIIHRVANKLNVQVFVSTHSRDTLMALQQAATEEQRKENTKVIKLKRSAKTQAIVAVEFDIDEMVSALEQNIELR